MSAIGVRQIFVLFGEQHRWTTGNKPFTYILILEIMANINSLTCRYRLSQGRCVTHKRTDRHQSDKISRKKGYFHSGYLAIHFLTAPTLLTIVECGRVVVNIYGIGKYPYLLTYLPHSLSQAC